MLALLQSGLAGRTFGRLAAPKGNRIPRAVRAIARDVKAGKLDIVSTGPTADGMKISGPSFQSNAVGFYWRLDSPEGFERGKVCHERHVGTSLRCAQA